MIKINKLSKKYGIKYVLNNINIDLPISGIIGLLGKNGSGKTTLLRIIAGLRKQTQGEILIKGEKVNNINKIVSITPDVSDIYDYTLYDLGKLYKTFFTDFNFEKYLSLINEGKIDILEGFSALSKGQKTYVILALSISRDVPIYLLDEPFSGLDVIVRKEIIDKLIKYLNVNNKLIIISSHDIDSLERLFDNVLVLKDGNLSYYTYEDIYQYESLKDFYKSVI